jgi:predicted outer membrane repeat protein
MFPRPSFGRTDPQVGLRTNSAAGDGGAAWVSGGYFAISGAPPRQPAPVVGNSAGGDGGALYFTGLASSSNIQHGIQFDDNHAGGVGGAFFADSGFLQMDSGFTGLGCSEIGGCPRFLGNHADLVGGAIALSGTAHAQVSNMMFSDNDAAHASVLQVGAAGTGVTLTNVHVAGNHGATELLRSSGAYIDLRYVTIADNGGDDDALIRFDAPGQLGASNSVLYDFNGAASGVVVSTVSGTTYAINCVLVHDDSGLDGTAGVTNLVSADPQWDTSGLYPAGLYVPGPDSPAVDACGPGTGTIPDMRGTARPQNLPKVDGLGPYDMGAVERIPDVILADGFEQH